MANVLTYEDIGKRIANIFEWLTPVYIKWMNIMFMATISLVVTIHFYSNKTVHIDKLIQQCSKKLCSGQNQIKWICVCVCLTREASFTCMASGTMIWVLPTPCIFVKSGLWLAVKSDSRAASCLLLSDGYRVDKLENQTQHAVCFWIEVHGVGRTHSMV